MRPNRRIGILLVLLAAAACGPSPYGSGRRGYGGYGGDPYGDPYYGRGGPSRREARHLAEEQAIEERRLQRLQRERREDLREHQEGRRESLEAAGKWDRRDARGQQRRRQQQRERFEGERERLQEHHEREWDRYGD